MNIMIEFTRYPSGKGALVSIGDIIAVEEPSNSDTWGATLHLMGVSFLVEESYQEVKETLRKCAFDDIEDFDDDLHAGV